MIEEEDADGTSLLAECLHRKLNIDDEATQSQTKLLTSSDPSTTTPQQHAREVHPAAATTVTVSERRCSSDPCRRRPPPLILCDLGYGVPKEERPRKERMLAIAKQLVNFLQWQAIQVITTNSSTGTGSDNVDDDNNNNKTSMTTMIPAKLLVVGCPDKLIEKGITDRMRELWNQQQQQQQQVDKRFRMMIPFPDVEFSDNPLQSFENAIYLSPDSDHVLDVTKPPPTTVVVGLLIDRRIQVNRSRKRANGLSIPTARWPLENMLLVSSNAAAAAATTTTTTRATTTTSTTIDPNEPLNVDCVLEGMQQWYWNYDTAAALDCHGDDDNDNDNDDDDGKKSLVVSNKSWCFEQAALQALRHHQERHPERPMHKTS